MRDGEIYKLVGDACVLGSKQYMDSLEKIQSVHLRLKVLEGITSHPRKLIKCIALSIFAPKKLNDWLISELTGYVELAKKNTKALADQIAKEKADLEKQVNEAKIPLEVVH